MQDYLSAHSMDPPHMPSFDSFQAGPQPPMAMAQMASFASNQQQAAQHADQQDRARAYKSRNKRPCDFWYGQYLLQLAT